MNESDEKKRWREAAEQALTALWEKPIACEITQSFREEGRNRVYRLAVTGGPVASVILKASLGDDQKERFCNEWAGCAILGPLGLGPVVYTGDTERGFYLMEDLGEGVSLADRLTGDDPEAATQALLAYAHSLGELHAATRGQESHWAELRQVRGGTPPKEADSGSFQAELLPFRGLCEGYGQVVPAAFEAELARIDALVENPGEYLVFSPTDCCPDNHFLRGKRVVFFDCEGARMRHALHDVVYFFAPFPTCWCMSRLPEGMSPRLLAAYQEHFPGGPDFDEQLTHVLAGWTMMTLLWGWAGGWQETDSTWGLVTLRQRHLHRLENLLAQPNLVALLPAVAEVAGGLYGILKARWTDLEPMPLYPAFRGEKSFS